MKKLLFALLFLPLLVFSQNRVGVSVKTSQDFYHNKMVSMEGHFALYDTCLWFVFNAGADSAKLGFRNDSLILQMADGSSVPCNFGGGGGGGGSLNWSDTLNQLATDHDVDLIQSALEDSCSDLRSAIGTGGGSDSAVVAGYGLLKTVVGTIITLKVDSSTFVNKTGTQTITNKSISGSTNTITNLDTTMFSSWYLMVRAALSAGSGLTFSSGAFSITAGGVTNAMLAGSIAYSKLSLTGAILNADLAGSIANAKLANSSITINGSSVSLGGTRTLALASSDFANNGTTTTLLHGNASGNPSFGAIVAADITSAILDSTKGVSSALGFISSARMNATNDSLYLYKNGFKSVIYFPLKWNNVTSTPTTLSGYGITDGNKAGGPSNAIQFKDPSTGNLHGWSGFYADTAGATIHVNGNMGISGDYTGGGITVNRATIDAGITGMYLTEDVYGGESGFYSSHANEEIASFYPPNYFKYGNGNIYSYVGGRTDVFNKLQVIGGGDGIYLGEYVNATESGLYSSNGDQEIATFDVGAGLYQYGNGGIEYSVSDNHTTILTDSFAMAGVNNTDTFVKINPYTQDFRVGDLSHNGNGVGLVVNSNDIEIQGSVNIGDTSGSNPVYVSIGGGDFTAGSFSTLKYMEIRSAFDEVGIYQDTFKIYPLAGTGTRVAQVTSTGKFTTGLVTTSQADTSSSTLSFATNGDVARTDSIQGKSIAAPQSNTGKYLVSDGTNYTWGTPSGTDTTAIRFVFDGQGGTVATGSTSFKRIPFNCTVLGWSILAKGTSPTATFDIWKVASGTALPAVGNTIMGTKPALASGNAVASTTLTSWTVAWSKDDIVGVNTDAISAGTWYELTIVVVK